MESIVRPAIQKFQICTDSSKKKWYQTWEHKRTGTKPEEKGELTALASSPRDPAEIRSSAIPIYSKLPFGKAHSEGFVQEEPAAGEPRYLPTPPLREPLPERVCAYHPLNELFPQHPLRDDSLPLLTHQLCCTQGSGIEIGKDVFCYVI